MTINLKTAFRATDAFIEDAEPDADLRVTPEMSASAQDFAFGKSVWEVVDGNPDGASVSGVAGISLIGSDEVDARGRKKDDDKDGISWDDVMEAQDRIRAEIMRIGNIDITRSQVEATVEFLSDPKNKERAAVEYARRNGTSVADGRAEVDWFHMYLSTKLAIADGTATPDQIAWMEQQDANPATAMRVDRVYEATHALGADVHAGQAASLAVGDAPTVIASASTGDVARDDAVASNIEDNAIWEDARAAQGLEASEIGYAQEMRSGGSDSLAFLGGDTRSGPVITSVYNNVSATGEQELAQAPSPAEPVQRSNVEFGLG